MVEKTEMELSKDFKERLIKKYGSERIEEQPHIDIGDRIRRPDFIVYKGSDKTEPLIVFELKADLGQSIHSGIKQVKSFMKEVDSKFGALVTHKFTYSFYLTETDNREYEVTIPELPNLDETYPEDKKSFENIEHLLFCFEKIFSTDYENLQNDIDLTRAGIRNLTRKVFAEKQNIELQWHSEILKDLKEIDEIIGQKYAFYNQSSPIRLATFSKLVHGVFNGYQFEETDMAIKSQFLEKIISREEKVGENVTKNSIAEIMVKLATLQNGDTVLDPAVGIGNILRFASKKGADCHGIEISKEILSYAIFSNEILNLDMDLHNMDFLEYQGEKTILNKFNHIFIDPPLGMRITDEEKLKSIGLDKVVNIEDAFLKKGLESLEDGGELITLLPIGFLYKENKSSLRDYIKNNKKIGVIIEIVNSGAFSHRVIPGVIMKIINTEPPEDYEIKVAEIKSGKKFEKKLDRVVETINENNCETINFSKIEEDFSPSKIRSITQVKDELNEKFDSLTTLSDICEIKRGVRVEKGKRVNHKEGDFPFLRIGDVDKNFKNISYVRSEDIHLTTDDTDVLISIKGTIGKVYFPEKEIVPAQSWIVLRFESKEEALVYATFLETKLAERQLSALKTGSTIPYVSIKDLSNLYIPAFKKEEINQKAKEIIEIQSELENYQQHTDEIKRKLKEVF